MKRIVGRRLSAALLCLALCLQLLPTAGALSTGITAKLTMCAYGGSTLSATVRVNNSSGAEQDIDVILALKSADATTLLASVTNTLTVSSGEKEYILTLPYPKIPDDYTVEIYFWAEQSNLVPVAAPLVYHSGDSFDPVDGFELKDVTSLRIYKLENGEAVYCEYLDPDTVTDLNAYTVEFQMRDMPTTYAGIKSCTPDRSDPSRVSIELDRANLMTYDKNGTAIPYRVSYPARPLTDLNELLEAIRKDPSGTFTLTQDYDASNVTLQRQGTTQVAAAVLEAFSGVLDGNGHTIYNLNVPLFARLEGGAVRHLVIRDSHMDLERVALTGAVANQATDAVLEDVHVRGLYLYSKHQFSGSQNNARRSGALVGDLLGGSTISASSATDFILQGQGTNSGGWFGGIAGHVGGTSKIEDCLAQGTIRNITGNQFTYKSVGGITGALQGSGAILRCVALVNNTCGNMENGGLVGFTDAPATVSIQGSFAVGDTTSAKGYRFIGMEEKPLKGTRLDFISNSYELDGAKGNTNVATVKETVIEIQLIPDDKGNLVPTEIEVVKDVPEKGGPVDSITGDEQNTAAFYRDTLGFSDKVWMMEYVRYSGMPYPGASFPLSDIDLPNGQDAYLPNRTVFTTLFGYAPANETAYSNAYRLMPFLNSQNLIEVGNQLARAGGELREKVIKDILMLDGNGYQPAVTTENYADFHQIFVVFTDNTTRTYTLTEPALQEGLARYTLAEYDIPFAYARYAVDVNNPYVKSLVTQVLNTPYEMPSTEEGVEDASLLSLVGGRDVNTSTYSMAAKLANEKKLGNQTWSSENDVNRLDETYEALMENPGAFVYGLLSADSGYYPGSDNPAAVAKIQASLGSDLKRLMYSYLYIQRWYDIDLGAVHLADVMYFSSDLYGGTSKMTAIADAVVGAARAARRGTGTHTMYNNRLKPIYGSSSVSSFIADNVALFEGQTDTSQWFRTFFKGPLEEFVYTGDGWRGRTAWELMSRDQSRILPLLSFENDPVEGKDLYIITYSHTLHYGVVSSYVNDYTNPAQYAEAYRLVKNYADNWINIITASATFVENPSKVLSQNYYESRDSAYLSKYGIAAGHRIPACDEKASPAFRNFAAVINTLQVSNDASAWATGSLMAFETSRALDANSMGVSTHENAHNNSHSYFYGGHANRMGSEGETNGILAQFMDNAHVMEFSVNMHRVFPDTTNYVGALSYQRLTGVTEDGSKTNIHDFYRKYFEAFYMLDIIESRALLSLDKETQRSLIYRHSYPNEKDGEERTALSRRDSAWNPVATLAEYEALQIKDYTGLIENHMNITRDVERGKKYGGWGNYNFGSPFSDYFWSPYNDMGRTDQITAKKMPYELLGESGWQYGFANYLSKSAENGSNDLGALRVAMAHTDLLDEPAAKASGANLDPAAMTYEDWKIARYAVVEDKLDTIGSPYFDADTLEEAYRAAFLADANRYGTVGMGPTPTSTPRTETKPYSASIRLNMIRYLQRITNDFESGIFEADRDLISISTAQELVDQVTAHPKGNFVLAADLDFSTVTATGEVYIPVTHFMGRIDGAGHTIRNLSRPLFQSIIYGHVENVVFDGVNVSGLTGYTGTVSRTANKGYFANLHIVNATLNGAKVGGVVGLDQDPELLITGDIRPGVNMGGSTFSGVSVNASITAKNTSGGIVSEGLGSLVANCYTRGTMNVSGGSRGGIIGSSQSCGISQSYSAMDWKQGGNGIVANNVDSVAFDHVFEAIPTWQYPTVVNTLGVNTGGNANRFHANQGGVMNKGFMNNYEYAGSPGTPNVSGSYIKSASEADLKNPAFYTDTLQFSAEFWDLSQVSQGKLPTLKNADPNAGAPVSLPTSNQ